MQAIDRIYQVAGLALLFFLRWPLIIGDLMFLFLGLLICAFVICGLALVSVMLTPKLQRLLLKFRSDPKSATPRLVRHLDLARPQGPDDLKTKAGVLAKAAHSVTLRFPSPLTGPLRLPALQKARKDALPAGNQAFLADLSRAACPLARLPPLSKTRCRTAFSCGAPGRLAAR